MKTSGGSDIASDIRKQSLIPYVRDLADRMGLKDWQITVVDRPPKDGNLASIWMRYGGKEAEVLLSEDFLGRTPAQRRVDLVHELTHLHFAAMDGLVEDWLDDEKYRGYQRMFEYGIDAVAEALAPHLPLLDESSKS